LLALLVILEWRHRHELHVLTLANWPRPARWCVYTVMVWTILYLGTYAQSTFIYFQF
jgi:hypothetical protein